MNKRYGIKSKPQNIQRKRLGWKEIKKDFVPQFKSTEVISVSLFFSHSV